MKKLILITCLLITIATTLTAQEVFDAVKANNAEKVKMLVEKDLRACLNLSQIEKWL